jgi:hypothetical protein
MPPRTVPFAPKLCLWPETASDIEKRLQRFLTELRQKRRATALDPAQPSAESLSEDGKDGRGGKAQDFGHVADLSDAPEMRGELRVELSYRDTTRITRRVRRLVEARKAVSGAHQHLRSEDLDRLRSIAGGATLAGPASEHAADELVARLYDEMPWHGHVLEILWRDLRQAAGDGLGLRFRPLLLNGAPGVGKTHLAMRLAELAAVPFVYVDVATSSEGWSLSGSQRTWGNSTPGRPVSTILESRVANVLVLVDEVEKGGVHQSHKGGVSTSAHHALLSLLEPASARVWGCPYFGTTFDMSHVNWLLASNDAHHLPAPLRSRLRIVAARGPTRAELLAFAARELAWRGLDDGAVSAVERLVHAYPEGDERLSVRWVLRLIEDLALIGLTTEVQH